LLAKLRQYFTKFIVTSCGPNKATSDVSNANLKVSSGNLKVSNVSLEVSKYNLLDGQGHTLTPHRLRGKAQLSIFMEGVLIGLTWKDFPLSQSIKK